MGILDRYMAKLVLAQQTPSVNLQGAPAENVKPYTIDLNKKQPTQTRQELLPDNIMEFPQVPDAIRPLVDSTLEKLQRIQALADQMKLEEAKLAKKLQAAKLEKKELSVEVLKAAQEIGPAIQAITPEVDQVVAYFKDMFILAQSESRTTVENTLQPSAQVEMLKKMILEVDRELGTKVIANFDTALKQFEVANTTVERTVRMWPIPESKLEAMMIQADANSNLGEIIMSISSLIHSGISELNIIQTMLHDGVGTPMKKVIPIETATPLAAQKKAQMHEEEGTR